jgi:hypothetical protein
MAQGNSLGANQELEEFHVNLSHGASDGKEKITARFKLLINKCREILIMIILSAVLIAAVMQPLFRKPLLAYLRSIFENY